MAEANAGVTVKIIDMTKVPSAEPDRMGKYDLVITYQDAAGRVRVIILPYEQFAGKSEAEQLELIKKAIKAQEEERLRFVGKSITL